MKHRLHVNQLFRENYHQEDILSKDVVHVLIISIVIVVTLKFSLPSETIYRFLFYCASGTINWTTNISSFQFYFDKVLHLPALCNFRIPPSVASFQPFTFFQVSANGVGIRMMSSLLWSVFPKNHRAHCKIDIN